MPTPINVLIYSVFFFSVDELRVLSEEELVERALQEAMEVTSLLLISLLFIISFWVAVLFESLMVFICRRTWILALHHNQRSKRLMKGKWPALTMDWLVYFGSVVD